MKTPIAWLREYVDLPSGHGAVVAKLAALGFPVDAVEQRPALRGIVVGRIEKIERPPKADRLQVCTIDVGAAQPLTIATAAQNVRAGQIVPVAVIGAQLATVTIARRKMMGIESEGMLVSAEEIGLPGEWFEDGILILEPELAPGTDFIAHFALLDPVLDVDVTPNRPDALSMIGLARELAAADATDLRLPPAEVATSGDSGDVTVRLESSDCTQFIAQRVSGATVRPAPFAMRLKLALAGQRPINNLVDISNYVMLETGQPLHFYDFEKLAGKTIVVRDPKPGERLVTLDGEDRELPAAALVIADAENAQSLAGLRGGAASEVSSATRELLVESADFHGPRIRRMSIAMGLRTEGSSRQEKSLPPILGELGAARAAYLLAAEGAAVRAAKRSRPPVAEPPAIEFPAGEVRRVLGIAVAAPEVESGLRGLGFTVGQIGENGALRWRVVPPPWRTDVAIAADVIEEIARVIGYDRIEASIPALMPSSLSSEPYLTERRIAGALAGLGFREVVRLSLEPASIRERYERAGISLAGKPLEISNPLSEDQRFLRSSLLPGLLALAQRERARPLDVFEIGHVFSAGDPPAERNVAGWCAFVPGGDAPSWRDEAFLAFKGRAIALIRSLCGSEPVTRADRAPELHPGKSATLFLGDKPVATIGAVDPRLLRVFDVEGAGYFGVLDLAELPGYTVPKYSAPSRFPGIARDLALVVNPDIAAASVADALREGGSSVARDIRVFDEYRGPQIGDGKKSLTVRLLLQRDDATMTDREADETVARMLDVLKARVGAEMRS